MTGYIWLIVDPDPARFSDEHNLWYLTVDAFSTRSDAVMELEARIPGLVWRQANKFQRWLIGADQNGNEWAIMRCPVDGEVRRYPCHTGEHAYHRSRANALHCKAGRGLVVA